MLGALLFVFVVSLGSVAHAAGPLTLLTSVVVGSIAHDIALQDTANPAFAYVATDAGLTVLDLANPAAPVPRGFVAARYAQGVEVQGHLAYLATKSRGLQIVDVTHPDAPAIIGELAVAYALDIAVRGTVAYIGTGTGDIHVIDVSVPTAPSPIRTIGLWAWASPGPDAQGLAKLNSYITNGTAKVTGISVTGNYLVAVDWGYGRLYYYDVTDATSPVFKGTFYAPYLLKAIVDDQHGIIYMHSAYGTFTSGIFSVPISYLAPNFAARYQNCPVCGYIKNGNPTVGLDQGGLALAAGGRYLVYNGGRNNGEVHVLDVQTPTAMQEASAWLPIGPHHVATSALMGMATLDDLAYLAAGALGVQVYHFAGLSGPPASGPLALTGFAISGGASSTPTRQVTLDHTVSGSPTEYRASELATFAGAAWQPYVSTPTFVLSAGSGIKRVYLQVRDATTTSGLDDTITLAEAPPTLASFAINGGSAATTTRTVTLDHTATGSPTEYRASELATFAGAPWLPYTPAPSFTFGGGNAVKRVYLQLRNAGGESIVRNDTITLREPLPTILTLSINAGATSTTSRTVTLYNTASADATEYRASESSTFAGAAWLPYATAPSFVLSAGNTTKHVYFQVRSATGAQSVLRYDSIALME
jgi:hypothetical protein